MTVAKLLRDGDEIGALDALLVAWRKTRAPQLAEAIGRLGERLEAHLPAIDGKRAELHAKWMAVAKAQRAVDWPQLVKTSVLTANRFGVAEVDALIERGKVLAAWPADPRTAAIVIEMVRRPGYEASSKSTQPFWAGLLDLLVAHGDARDGAALAKLDVSRGFRAYSDRAQAAKWFGEQVARTVERLAAKPASKASADEIAIPKSKLSDTQIAKLQRAPIVAPKPKARAKRPVATGSPIPFLEAARRGDDVLASLLGAWRVTRAPAIAELVETVSKRIALPAIDGKDRKAIHASWLATAKQRRDEDLPRLLASITKTLGRSTDAHARVRALDGWPADPRVTAGVVQALEELPFHTSSTKKFWSALIALVVDHGDPRAIDVLESLRERFPRILVDRYTDMTPMIRWFQRELERAVANIKPAPPLPSAAAALVAAIATELRAKNTGEDELFAQIAEHPGDDELKRVLADVLQQRGDPRGELIALQLAGREPERARALIQQHSQAWLGPLAPYVDEAGFAKGFPVSLALSARGAALDAVVGHPLWATVKSLNLGGVPRFPAALVRHPVMRSLEHLGGLDPERLEALLAGPPLTIRSLEAVLFEPAELHVLATKRAAEALPELRAIEVLTRARDLRLLLETPLGKRLERVVLGDANADAVRAGPGFTMTHERTSVVLQRQRAT